LKAFAERWIRSVKQECLSKVILAGEVPLSRVLAEYSRHDHGERNHQSREKQQGAIPERGRAKSTRPSCERRYRLGGLLKCYKRAAWIFWLYGMCHAAWLGQRGSSSHRAKPNAKVFQGHPDWRSPTTSSRQHGRVPAPV